MTTPVLAHTGHWATSLLIYLGPVLIIAVWLAWQSRRDKRAGRTDDDEPSLDDVMDGRS